MHSKNLVALYISAFACQADLFFEDINTLVFHVYVCLFCFFLCGGEFLENIFGCKECFWNWFLFWMWGGVHSTFYGSNPHYFWVLSGVPLEVQNHPNIICLQSLNGGCHELSESPEIFSWCRSRILIFRMYFLGCISMSSFWSLKKYWCRSSHKQGHQKTTTL